MSRSILFVAGGTGGHIYPAISVYNRLKEMSFGNDIDVVFVSSKRKRELTIYSSYGIKPIQIDVAGIPRKISFELFVRLLKIFLSIFIALLIVVKLKPKLIFTTGGYIAFPFSVASFIMRVPLFIHEQNVKMGLANRVSSIFAKKIFVSWEETLQSLGGYLKGKSYLTGVPIRFKEYSESDVMTFRDKYNISFDKMVVLVLGGSLGSELLCELACDLALDEDVKSKFEFILVGNYKNIILKKGCVKAVGYVEEISELYALSDVVISRAGASAVAEICSYAKPSILVPWSGASENHQYFNAKVISDRGCCFLLEETEDNLFDKSKRLLLILSDVKIRSDFSKKLTEFFSYHKEASSKIASIIIKEMA